MAQVHFEVYPVKRGKFKGQFRWRMRAENHKIIANGGESYFNLDDCLAAIELVKSSGAAVIVTLP